MAQRLKEADRVRSAAIYATEVLATTVIFDGTTGSHTFQDDVTVIGYQLSLKVNVLDAHLNADLYLNLMLELTRQASRDLPGSLGRVDISTGWSGILGPGGGVAKDLVIMFPKGQGIEIDEGEALNLLGYYSYIGAGGTIGVVAMAAVFYTER